MNQDQMLAQIEQLTQQLHTLQAATKDRAKLAPPTAFEGKVNSNVLTWLLTVEAYLHGCSTPAERSHVATPLFVLIQEWYQSSAAPLRYVLVTTGHLSAGVLQPWRYVMMKDL